jgi:hypothetical protein
MGPFEMVVMIVFIGTIGAIAQKYLDHRARHGQSANQSVQRLIQEVRAEMAALRQQTSEAVLSFDSTLQTLDARLKHVERRALGEGTAERPRLAGAPSSAEEPAHVVAGTADVPTSGAR